MKAFHNIFSPANLFLFGIFAIPMILLLAIVVIWRWNIDRKKEVWPVADKLLRPPGESLRRRIEELDEKFLPVFLTSILCGPVVFSLLAATPVWLGLHLNPIALLASAFLVGAAIYVWNVRCLFQLVNERRNRLLGYFGERAVGEEINQLMLHGCRIFHDVPMEPYGNIDHVIVAPSAVYAVETKTRRKRKAPPGRKDHEVFYNGEVLDYPHCTDSYGLEQASQQADRLRELLGKAVGEPVKVVPILTLPGWYITYTAKPKIMVMAPRGIRTWLSKETRQELSPEMMQRVAHQLDQKCRDVEL